MKRGITRIPCKPIWTIHKQFIYQWRYYNLISAIAARKTTNCYYNIIKIRNSINATSTWAVTTAECTCCNCSCWCCMSSHNSSMHTHSNFNNMKNNNDHNNYSSNINNYSSTINNYSSNINNYSSNARMGSPPIYCHPREAWSALSRFRTDWGPLTPSASNLWW